MSYGSAGAARALEHRRGVLGEMQIADVRNSVQLSLITDVENYSQFRPHVRHEQEVGGMMDQVVD